MEKELIHSFDRNIIPDFFVSSPLKVEEAAKLPGRVLAYIGDSVFELGTRLRHFLFHPESGKKLHGTIVNFVCAQNQAKLFDMVFDRVSQEEKDLLRHWRNMKLPRQTSVQRVIYAKSTAFEAWIGFLFLTGQNDRLKSILDQTLSAENR